MNEREDPSGEPALQPLAIPIPEALDDGVVVSPDTRRPQRLPPGQSRTRKWPVLDTGHHPPVLLRSDAALLVDGLVEAPRRWTFADLQSLPRARVFADMHCVTRWSRLGNLWEGVRVRDLLERVRPESRGLQVVAHGRDTVEWFKGGSRTWTTNLALADIVHDDVLVAWSHDGVPLTHEHGGPLRLVVPRLYAWKSAKWLHRLQIVDSEELGFWERGGYHRRGDPWREQRFRFSDGSDD
ncbi:MAG: molybdopterin-dependent oxidoreductase [Armatimonadota bacterium]